jgi:hypothetical protein
MEMYVGISQGISYHTISDLPTIEKTVESAGMLLLRELLFESALIELPHLEQH